MGRRLVAEWLGTLMLLATVIGSGIMAERLAGGNVALALLGNTIATGAILVVLITVFAPVSGAHFNPAVTLAFAIRKDITASMALLYIAFQIFGALCGAMLAPDFAKCTKRSCPAGIGGGCHIRPRHGDFWWCPVSP